MVNHIEPTAKLTRREVSTELRALGYRVAPSTLAVLAVKGGGPAFRKFGRHVLYEWATVLAWAEARLSAPVQSTAECPTFPSCGRERGPAETKALEAA